MRNNFFFGETLSTEITNDLTDYRDISVAADANLPGENV